MELDDLIQGWIAATAVAERERRVAAIVGAATVVAVRAARMNGISDEDAEDVAQHTCAKLVQHLSNGGRFTTSASAFVWRVAENRARDLHRSRKRTSEGNARLLAADANTRIRFVPNLNFTGIVKLAFVAWDQTSGTNGDIANTSTRGNTTPFSTLYDYSSLTII